ncbi:TetR family transcriptional regulator [Rhodospirillaceae bacterium KN72]|uniref:TetR family transcriptional regulator n=1 Tax=Pacificispira spongiicola TaxID=2729598 RepID=A0A7Y0DYW6_9PROT|nr:TetR family transcriptional regulator C-terminal domain-containing protein [Pacificispira spongiicola]NMM43351.1 TetR family transcriptional regulator [Pacificispira spongiicola]
MARTTNQPRFTRLTSEERRAELVDAGLTCMARGGIQEFTVDKICAEAGVSRGLITHHFGSMNGLLAAVYARMYETTTPQIASLDGYETRLAALIDAFFAPDVFNRKVMNIWLTLWGEISNNPTLRDEHRREYSRYVDDVAGLVAEAADARGRTVDARGLARALICLVDGLGLQYCIDPDSMPPEDAKAACRSLLEPSIGPL